MIAGNLHADVEQLYLDSGVVKVGDFGLSKSLVPVERHRKAGSGGGKGSSGGGKEPAQRRVVQARLQELGPRFTLKLLSLQKGTFDARGGEFEWVHNRKAMDTSRRKFHL